MIIVINLKFNDRQRKLFIPGSISMSISINESQNMCLPKIDDPFPVQQEIAVISSILLTFDPVGRISSGDELLIYHGFSGIIPGRFNPWR